LIYGKEEAMLLVRLYWLKTPRVVQGCSWKDASGQGSIDAGGLMLRWTAAFFVLALVAGIVGSLEIAPPAAALARLLCFVFGSLLLFTLIAFTLIGGLARRT
jgi:uncharacterized membrane protein YtjA (UPF0391 family)